VKVHIELRSSDSLTSRELDEIWAVTDRYVETSRSDYEAKLRTLPEVGLWRIHDGTLIGLVSLEAYQVRWEGQTSIIIFTSNVVIDARYRGSNAISRTGMKMFLREKRRHPRLPAYWFFDTFSYKSYLILPRNLAVFWPRWDRETPAPVAGFMDFLARERYGDAWSPETGMVRRTGKKRLRPDTAPLDERQRANPNARFFDTVNPGHRDGDVLVCLVPLTLRNLVAIVTHAITRR
jgi:hypothetical protein